jgi:hypothetical protein
MTGIPGPIQGDAIRRGLTHDVATEVRAAGSADRARLDEEELQALERAEYQGGADSARASTSQSGGFLERLWRRHRRSG